MCLAVDGWRAGGGDTMSGIDYSPDLLRRQADRIDGAQPYLAGMLRWAATMIETLRGQLRDPHGWQPMETYTPREVYVLVQDGEEVYRARRMGGVWRCDEGYEVHPTAWMPFAEVPR